MKNIVCMVLLAGGLLSCSSSKQGLSESATSGNTEQRVDMHNARNALDYQGVYSGTIPGTDVKAVNIVIGLTESDYNLRITPLKENAETTVQRGKYVWDESGSIITLVDAKGTLTRYFVGENHLRQLDADGKQRVGDEASHYMLRKEWNP